MKLATSCIAATVIALGSVGAAHAQQMAPKAYGELGLVFLGISGSDGVNSVKAAPMLLSGTVGYKLHPNVAVEGFLGFGISKDEIDLNGAASGVNAKAGNAFGVFLKPGFEPTPGVELFARVGYVRSKIELSAGGFSVSESDTDVAYGIGANFNLSSTSYIQANWMTYYKDQSLKADGIGLVYGIRF